MPKTVEILGHSFSQGQVIAGGGALAFVGGYTLWKYEKNKKAAAAAASSASTAATPAAYGYGYAYGYGAPSQYYGYGFGYGTESGASADINGEWEYGYGEYGYGYYNSATGAFEGAAAGTPTPTGGVPATNAEWSIAVTNTLTQEGLSATTVAPALAAYLQGQPLTPAQISIVSEALAYGGNPPQSGPDGYPPAYKTASGTGGGGGQSTKVRVPGIVGLKGDTAKNDITGIGLKWKQTPASTPKGKTTTVTAQSPRAGTQVNSGSTVTATLKTDK